MRATTLARRILERVIREIGPPSMPVRFRQNIPEDGDSFGICIENSDHYLIRLQKGLPESMLRETVIHELAHAYLFTEHEFRTHHDAVWGVVYSEVYRAAFGVE